MKSLEIVNKSLEEKENECYQFYSIILEKQIKELRQIKQDLEILEILQVLILHNGKSVGYKGIISDFEVMLRLGKITQEQLDRLKQWLEENEK